MGRSPTALSGFAFAEAPDGTGVARPSRCLAVRVKGAPRTRIQGKSSRIVELKTS